MKFNKNQNQNNSRFNDRNNNNGNQRNNNIPRKNNNKMKTDIKYVKDLFNEEISKDEYKDLDVTLTVNTKRAEIGCASFTVDISNESDDNENGETRSFSLFISEKHNSYVNDMAIMFINNSNKSIIWSNIGRDVHRANVSLIDKAFVYITTFLSRTAKSMNGIDVGELDVKRNYNPSHNNENDTTEATDSEVTEDSNEYVEGVDTTSDDTDEFEVEVSE